jgi:hypothetical protein
MTIEFLHPTRSRASRVGTWDYDLDHFRKHVEQRLLRDFAASASRERRSARRLSRTQ